MDDPTDTNPSLAVTRFAGQPARTAPMNALRRRERNEPPKAPPTNALRSPRR